MNRIWIIIGFICLTTAVYSDELDSIIGQSLKQSPKIQTIDRSLEIDTLTKDYQYLSLFPDLGLSASASANSSSAGIAFSANLSKSFSDLDGTWTGLQTAENTLKISKVQTEASKRSWVSYIITTYADFSLQRRQIDLKKASLQDSELYLNILNIQYNSGKEIALTVAKQSNDIRLLKQDLKFSELSYSNSLRIFQKKLGFTVAIRDTDPKAEFGISALTNEIELTVAKHRLTLSNNMMKIHKKERETFLPTVGVSGYCKYDTEANAMGYGVSLNLSFSFLDIFLKQNEIKQMNIQNSNLISENEETIMLLQEQLELMKQQCDILVEKIELSEDNIKLAKRQLELYKYQYEVGTIDFYEFSRHQTDILSEQLSLATLQNKLYLLKKRLQYGIVQL